MHLPCRPVHVCVWCVCVHMFNMFNMHVQVHTVYLCAYMRVTYTCPTLCHFVLLTITLTLTLMFSTSERGGASRDHSRQGEHALE